MFCPNCGAEIENSAKFCYKCGQKITADGKKDVVSSSSGIDNHTNNGAPDTNMPAPGSPDVYKFGLLGIILAFFTGIGGIILSAIGLSKAKEFKKLNGGKLFGKAKTGYTMSIIGLTAGIIILVVAAVSGAASAAGEKRTGTSVNSVNSNTVIIDGGNNNYSSKDALQGDWVGYSTRNGKKYEWTFDGNGNCTLTKNDGEKISGMYSIVSSEEVYIKIYRSDYSSTSGYFLFHVNGDRMDMISRQGEIFSGTIDFTRE